ncbi:MAG: pectate lyase [Acidobacteria bacterium]|nr:MAG: pectate lyase [Acidobacteriota bacterium]
MNTVGSARSFAASLVFFTVWLAAGVSLVPQPLPDQVPASPHAEGHGRYARGGRAGAVVFVTNLDDSGPGSLREAVRQSGPRTVVFRVSGIIQLESPLTITESFLTVAGETAPGDGICLRRSGIGIEGASDVIIRHLRVRPGDEVKTEQDALNITRGSRNILIDHVSASWSNDEVLSVSGPGIDNVTVQWCLISESLNRSHHSKGAHGYGSLIRTDGKVSFHHNIYAHNSSRNPRPGTYGNKPGLLFDFRNNVIYNWGSRAGYTAEDPARINYVANYLKPGPSSQTPKVAFSVGGATTRLFVADNVLEGTGDLADPWQIVRLEKELRRDQVVAEKAFDTALVLTQPAREACRSVLKGAGAVLPRRDPVDNRIIHEIEAGQGRIIDSQKEVGGWPAYKTGPVPVDKDNDGLPDAWEELHGLDPDNPSDHAADRDKDGYTNLEEYLQELTGGR